MALSRLRNYHRLSFPFSEEELKVLNDLRNDNDIIMKPDKGNGIVILDKKKMEDILSDTNKVRLLHDDSTTIPLSSTLQQNQTLPIQAEEIQNHHTDNLWKTLSHRLSNWHSLSYCLHGEWHCRSQLKNVESSSGPVFRRCELESCSSQHFSVGFGSVRLSWKHFRSYTSKDDSETEISNSITICEQNTKEISTEV